MGGGLKKIFWFNITIITVSVMCGCGDDYCGESGSGIPLVGIYTMGNPPKKGTIDSLTVYGKDQKKDSILYKTVRNSRAFYNHLDIAENSLKYVLLYEKKGVALDHKFDTLTYVYSKELEFDSPECGAKYYFTIKEFYYTRHSIVFAELVTPLVDNLSSETVKIYYDAGN
ncbi:MAG: DUF6452 family protein [Bacteroidales bacterium]